MSVTSAVLSIIAGVLLAVLLESVRSQLALRRFLRAFPRRAWFLGEFDPLVHSRRRIVQLRDFKFTTAVRDESGALFGYIRAMVEGSTSHIYVHNERAELLREGFVPLWIPAVIELEGLDGKRPVRCTVTMDFLNGLIWTSSDGRRTPYVVFGP